MPLKLHPTDESPNLNLTSMIDVLFLLILFFMVATRFAAWERTIGLKLPEVSGDGPLSSAPEQRVVNVFRDGRVMLDKQDVTLDELRARLATARRQYADLGVLIRGDGSGAFQRVAEVLQTCNRAGVSELAISVRLTPEQRR